MKHDHPRFFFVKYHLSYPRMTPKTISKKISSTQPSKRQNDLFFLISLAILYFESKGSRERLVFFQAYQPARNSRCLDQISMLQHVFYPFMAPSTLQRACGWTRWLVDEKYRSLGANSFAKTMCIFCFFSNFSERHSSSTALQQRKIADLS